MFICQEYFVRVLNMYILQLFRIHFQCMTLMLFRVYLTKLWCTYSGWYTESKLFFPQYLYYLLFISTHIYKHTIHTNIKYQINTRFMDRHLNALLYKCSFFFISFIIQLVQIFKSEQGYNYLLIYMFPDQVDGDNVFFHFVCKQCIWCYRIFSIARRSLCS